MSVEPVLKFPGISPRSYEHPADQAATAALHAVPLLDSLVKRFGAMGAEARIRQALLGDAVCLGPDQLPEVWAAHQRVAARFGATPVQLFVTQHPVANAVTVGLRQPAVVLHSSMILDYSPAEVEAVLGHELGHVLSDHGTYATALAMLSLAVKGAVSDLPLAGLPVRGLYYALLEWHRATELTGDRVAALAVDDPMVVCGMLMRTAGGAIPGLRVEAFVRQATQYVEEDDLLARKSRLSRELGQTHPATVRRVRELVAWVQSGDFDRIRSGQYIRRGEEPPLSSELQTAVSHYRQRFGDMVGRTAGGVDKVSKQMASWLARTGGRPERGAGDAADRVSADGADDPDARSDGGEDQRVEVDQGRDGPTGAPGGQ